LNLNGVEAKQVEELNDPEVVLMQSIPPAIIKYEEEYQSQSLSQSS
jgi:hypothetical protein